MAPQLSLTCADRFGFTIRLKDTIRLFNIVGEIVASWAVRASHELMI